MQNKYAKHQSLLTFAQACTISIALRAAAGFMLYIKHFIPKMGKARSNIEVGV